MNISELIKSYPVPSFDFNNFIIYWIVIGAILIGITFIILYRKDKKIKLVENVGLSFVFMVIMGVMIGVSFYCIEPDLNEARAKWKEEVFQKQYIASLKEVKVVIIDYSIDKDGFINVLLDTTEKEKSMGDIRQINYYNSKDPVDRGYIKAKYVESIEEIGIAAGYYDVQAFIPKMTK